MATLRIIVPTTEHADGIVEYTGDITPIVDETRTLYVQQGTLILAEFPVERYESWELIEDAPLVDEPAPAHEG